MPVFNGDAANNLLDARFGGDSNDTLDGGLGADTMWGGDGSDVYFVDDVGDIVEEQFADALGGNDTVIASVSYSLDIAPSFFTRGIENLVLTGSAANGTGNVLNNVITGNDADNLLAGLGGQDTLTGGGGNDTLVGGDGNDSFVGGAGVDWMQGDGGNDSFDLNGTSNLAGWIVDGGTDLDTADLAGGDVQLGTSLQFFAVERMEVLGTRLRGTAGDDNYDFTGITPLNGGAEFYFVVNAGDGNDTITAATNISDQWGQESYGQAGNDSLLGGANKDYLFGDEGNDTLVGGAGLNEMYGGNGDDVYVLSAGSNFVNESGDGTDLVLASINHTLAANVENLTLTGTDALTGAGNELANRIIGNESSNSLAGGDGDDTLDGGAGADTLSGGAGNDRYLVDAVDDLATEFDNDTIGGVDTVEASISYALTGLATGQNSFGIENIVLAGSADIDATGNASANGLIGNNGANELRGGAGDDSLQGGDGNDVLTGSSGADTLDGGTGSDVMVGGDGADLYRIDNASDVVAETGTTGIDTVESLLSHTLGSGLENLTLVGTAAINGTGNAAGNALVGNDAANTLSGAAGGDTMTGGNGNDTYVVDVAGDQIVETATAATQIDTVRASLTWSLAPQANLESLVLSGTGAINGTGNARANAITGNSAVNTLSGSTGNDTLDGGGGADSLVGGAGNDTYVVNVAGDQTFETGTLATEVDLVRASLSWTLGTNLEQLLLTGTGAFTGTGNTLANRLTGNTGANTLLGLTGADTLDGAAGSDILDGGIGNDSLIGGTGADTFRFSTTLNATSNIDAVSGFARVDDRFLLDDAVFVGIGAVGALAAGAFRSGTAALERDDRVIYNKAQGKLYFDADGFGGAAQVLFATVAINTDIRADDFFIG